LAKLSGEVNHTFASAAVGFSPPRAIDMVRAIIDDAIRIIDPHHDTIPVAGDIEYRAGMLALPMARLTFAGHCPVSSLDLPIPRHHPSAGAMSVWMKSSPLKRSGSPVTFESA